MIREDWWYQTRRFQTEINSPSPSRDRRQGYKFAWLELSVLRWPGQPAQVVSPVLSNYMVDATIGICARALCVSMQFI
jgi:hypothetical protein